MRTLAELARPRAAPAEERCELCGDVIPAEHRHVADVERRSLLCACRACTILLGRPGAGGGHYRLVPRRRLRLHESPVALEALDIPIGLAFLFFSSAAGRVITVYPSPGGPTESQLPIDVALDGFEPDVEALLVHDDAHFLVPIDDCYVLVALIRTHWRGLAGGSDVRRELAAFFERLQEAT